MLAVSLPITALFAGGTFWYIDHPYQQYQIALGRALAAQGLLTGYDPFFGGGYLGGVSFNVSGRFPVLLAQVLPGALSTQSLYKAYVAGCSVIAPLMVVWFAWQRRWGPMQSLVACATGIIFWWCSAFRWYDTAGMVSFVFSCYFGITYAAWIWCLSTSSGQFHTTRSMFAAVVGGLACWLHPLFPIIVFFVFAGYLCIEWRSVAWKSFFSVILFVSTTVLGMNAPWIVSMLHTANVVVDQPYQRAFGWSFIWQPMLNPSWPMGSFLYPLSVVLCIMGLMLRSQTPKEVLPLVLAGLAMLVFSAFGGIVPAVGLTQPNRFMAPAFLLLGYGASYAAPELSKKFLSSRYFAVRAMAFLAAVAIVGYACRELQREGSSGQHGHHGKAPPELTAAPEIVQQLAAWILSNTTDDARILFETSLGRIHGGGHVAGMLSLMTRRELIGGPYPFLQPSQSFWDHVGFGKPIGELSASTFRTGLDDFNVGWIVAHSVELQRFVELSGIARVVKDFGDIKIYRLNRTHSFVESGRIFSIRRAFNRIEVDTVQGQELVLRYNWIPGLKVTFPARLEAVEAHPGFPPLIRVINPPAHFVLSTCEQCLK